MFNFPWSNFHELNLDWFLTEWNNFKEEIAGKIAGIAKVTATAESVPSTEEASVTVTGGSSESDPYKMAFKIPRGSTTTVRSSDVKYCLGTSGSSAPSGPWVSTPPAAESGKYMWTRTILTYTDDSSATWYSIGYFGTDGSGAVNSVNGKTGAVTITASDIGTTATGVSVQDSLDTQASNITDINSELGSSSDLPTPTSSVCKNIKNLSGAFNYKNDHSLRNKIVCIGDSYILGHTSGSDVTSWAQFIASKLGKTVDTDLFIYGLGGTGFVTTVSSKNFLSLLNDAAEAITDPENVTAVIVCGGANDRSNTVADIQSAISTFVSTAKSSFTNAMIYVGLTTVFNGTTSTNGETTAEKIKILNAYAAAKNYGAVYLGNIGAILQADKTLFDSDLMHPTENGQSRLAERIINAINGGDNSITTELKTITPGEAGNIRTGVVNDMFMFDIASPGRITQAVSISSCTMNGSNLAYTYDFSSYADYLPNFGTDGGMYITTGGAFRDDGGYYDCTFTLHFVGHKIEIYPYKINTSNNGFYQATNITTLHICGCAATCPVDMI